LGWIDHGDRQSRVEHRRNERTFEASGRFDDDELWLSATELLDEFSEAFSLVGGGKGIPLRKKKDIEFFLGNIDTNKRGRGVVHENIPVLRIRARWPFRARSALAAVRA
jgi:hypothetical protein